MQGSIYLNVYNCNLQVKLLFYGLKTIASLVNCTCKSFIKLTPVVPILYGKVVHTKSYIQDHRLYQLIVELHLLLFVTLVMIRESKTRKIKYFRGLNARRYVQEGIAEL